MTYEEFAADLTARHSFRFHSAEEAEEVLKALGLSNYELRQLGRGSFRNDLAAILTSEGIALSHRFERSFFSPLHTPDGMVTLLMTSPGLINSALHFYLPELRRNNQITIAYPIPGLALR